MSDSDKNLRTKKILEQITSKQIIEIIYEEKIPRILVVFKTGINVYIRYNKHEEYSYSILFSASELDRCRFDNFDKQWEVSTKPHHYHPRMEKNAFKSPMKGIPEDNIPKLCDLIEKGKIFQGNFRF
jgi:hypothetical protein